MPTIHPIKQGTSIIYDMTDDLGALTNGKTYIVLEDETKEGKWRIIRVTCDDGQARKVPPQYFISTAGKQFGCRECLDRGIIQGGEDQGAFIKACYCPALTDENIYTG